MQSQQAPSAVLELAHELSPSILPGPYTQREEVQIKREAEGEVSYNYVENNGKPNNSMYLIGLKNIYAKQLPNMPKVRVLTGKLSVNRSCANNCAAITLISS